MLISELVGCCLVDFVMFEQSYPVLSLYDKLREWCLCFSSSKKANKQILVIMVDLSPGIRAQEKAWETPEQAV